VVYRWSFPVGRWSFVVCRFSLVVGRFPLVAVVAVATSTMCTPYLFHSLPLPLLTSSTPYLFHSLPLPLLTSSTPYLFHSVPLPLIAFHSLHSTTHTLQPLSAMYYKIAGVNNRTPCTTWTSPFMFVAWWFGHLHPRPLYTHRHLVGR
jgi:hypothetical protein